ncbi:AsmA-like C-terminal region-containing protein [Enterovirga sp.]|uniref:YhdP family protein n=1 Tax=Enterovirga sp. TaxID=2026350 RepID=UPI00261C83EA|nr:AsmA-like C-terminal region-containing protein [Enterovirga sp.]MDB5592865.1 hypothetical protein [Enterovirga sp.]
MRPSRRERVARLLRGILYVGAGLVALVAMVAGVGYLRLLAGPVQLNGQTSRVSEALRTRIGPGWSVTLGDAALELHGLRPAVRAAGFEIRDPGGVPVLRAPHAVVSLDPWSLLRGAISAREVELRDLQLRAVVSADGSLTFLTGEGDGAAPAAVAAPSAPAGSPLAVILASLLAPVVDPSGVVGALDRASVRGAQLTLVGPDGRERAVFRRLDLSLERAATGERQLALELVGPHGPWGVSGRVTGGKFRGVDLRFRQVPAADIALLAGLAAGAGGSDVLFSGGMTAGFLGTRLIAIEGGFESSAGSVQRGFGPPIRLDRLAGRASWNEEARRLNLSSLEISSEGTEVRLSGEMGPAPEGGWRVTLGGRDARFAGIKPTDKAFAVQEIAAEATIREGAVSLDRAVLRGQEVDIQASGKILPGPEGHQFEGVLEAQQTELRRLVRLWPDRLNPNLRRYLAERVGAGRLERLRLRSRLDAREFAQILTDAPLSDGAVDLAFAARDVELDVVDGLPPLRGVAIDGTASGTRTALRAASGRIETPDQRSLAFSEGSYVHDGMDKPDSQAQVGFAVTGGADALVSLLKSPALREAIAIDFDPDSVRGRVDIRVRLPLVPSRVPTLANMPLSVRATLSDIAADRLPGRERLENGAFTLSYEAGALTGRGEGKLGGVPATFDLAAAPGRPGELAIGLVLDEAARARRSLPVGPQLAGPVPVRIAVPLGGRRTGARVEADLGRAAIDGLIPGWTKAANRPGRLTFTASEGEGGATEIRDVSLEAGSVQIKGQARFAAAGALESADLQTFKLSPGDDLRAQFERAPNGPYRVGIKGNVGDARPVLRWVTSSSGKAGGRDDVELDLAVNILTGHNDEAMTGVAGKATIRGGDLRALQFTGRFRSALVEAQLAKRDAGAPVLSVRSGDAGATLRFLDVYRRMVGGRLSIEGRSGDGAQSGNVWIEEFGLRDEPALRSIVARAENPATTGGDQRGAPVARSDLDQVLFNRLSAEFKRSGSRIDLADVVIYGAQVGFNLSGFVDYGRERLDMGGTFVPAYLLNNAFSQLPLVGILLGGGATEGLIAVDFRVTGPISGPTLSVNPLTVVTPGILRKLFGWMLPDTAEETPAPPRTSRAPPARPRPAR